MKKKIFMFFALVAIIACFFAISISAETPSNYITFKVKLTGADEYITAYTKDVFPTDSKFDFNEAFYSDIDFTQVISKDSIEGVDLSDATPSNKNTFVKYVAAAKTPYANCKEIKWFGTSGSSNSIGTVFFQNWTSLESFDFGIATQVIDKAFNNTGFKTLVIPSTITTVKGGAFSGCVSLTTLKIEGDISSLSGSAFQGCTSLVNVDLGNSLTTIGETMFSGCTALTSIEIPASVTKIKKQAFNGCTALSDVTFGNISSIGESAFYNSGITSVTIPKEVTSVGNSAFANCKRLTTVIFEEGFCGTLGSSAFMGTESLTTLTLVEGIKAIPSQCFWTAGSKYGIEKVTLPDSVESLAGRAFNGSGIKVLEIRETSNLKSITGDAFAGMKELTSIYLPTGVVISCDNLFQYCHKLEEVLNFENVKFNISSYGENVFVGKIFYECLALKEIKIPHSATAIVGSAFRLYKLEKVYIPSSVTAINSGWLDNTTHLPSTVTFFYCGGDANKLLSLTDDSTGVVSTRLAGMIENNSVVEYKGMGESYDTGVIVCNVNFCDVYYDGVHLDSDEIEYTYIDEHGNPTVEAFTSLIKVYCPCDRDCGNETVIKVIPALFTCLGYSVSENGNFGITIGFLVDHEAILEYNALTGETVKYGMFAASETKLDGNNIFDDSGNAADGVIVATISNCEFNLFVIKVTGFNDEQKDARIAMGAYVAVTKGEKTEYSYIQPSSLTAGDKYSFVSYNDLLAQLSK